MAGRKPRVRYAAMGGGPGPAWRRAWWWPVALPAALTAAAWLIQVLVSADLPGWGRAVLVVAGTLSALLAFALPARQLAVERRTRDAAEQLASEAVASYKIKVHDMLIPLALTVGEAVAASRAGRAAGRTGGVAPDGRGLRGRERRPGAQPRLLLPAGRVGAQAARGPEELARPAQGPARRPSPRTLRAARWCWTSSPTGTRGWWRTWTPPTCPAGPRARRSTRRSSAPRSPPDPRVFGILTVDSLHPGDLTEDDLDMARLFAHLLATGLAAD